jgi:putative transposase
MLFHGTAHTELVNHWFETQLIPELRSESTIIWDNAKFHNKDNLAAIAAKYGQYVIFLPKYSPDLSKIEPDFANLKRIRQYLPPGTPIDDIIKSYNCYSE